MSVACGAELGREVSATVHDALEGLVDRGVASRLAGRLFVLLDDAAELPAPGRDETTGGPEWVPEVSVLWRVNVAPSAQGDEPPIGVCLSGLLSTWRFLTVAQATELSRALAAAVEHATAEQPVAVGSGR